MWIVALTLRRPYTFVVTALLILILTPVVVERTPTDVFPNIDIPVISVVWHYQGLAPDEMANRITTITERGLTTLVNDIEHIESESLNGIAVVKIFFQPTANIQTPLAQVNGTDPADRNEPPQLGRAATE
jgi:multidrug efflux pump subunit AcrB